MGNKGVKGVLAAALIALLAAVSAWAEPPQGSAPQGSPLGKIKTVKALPINGMVMVDTDQGVFFASDNGRFVMKGPLFDMWNRREIKDVADVESMASRVDLQKIGVDFKQLAVLNFGEGKKEEVFFISPTCPACKTVLDQAAKLAKEYRFKVVLLPQSREDMNIARSMVCSKDQDWAVKTLLSRNYKGLPPGNCPLTPLQKNLVTARMLGITKVPYLIRHDAMHHNGAVNDLAAWLKEAQDTGGH
ncbi:MAG: DsbC family protein [Thermodesulfobacteriota bacterium]